MSQIRECFTSRFIQGCLLEVDFSQLEVLALAYLSNDAALRSDLISGKDLHAISASMLFGDDYTPAQRKIAKQLSFQLQYGAQAKSMAETNGIPVSVAKDFISNYYKRYPGVGIWQEKIAKEVLANRRTDGRRTAKGKPAGVSTLKSITGREYTFVEQDIPEEVYRKKGSRDTSFSPTQMKNYLVQGFATADIVPMVLGKLLRSSSRWGNGGLLVATIHDSVVFDVVHKKNVLSLYRVVKEIMEDAPRYLKEDFGINFDLPLRAEGEFGTDWGNMSSIDILA